MKWKAPSFSGTKFEERWPKYTLLRPFINLQKSKIKIISLFPDTSNKKRIYVFPNKGSNIVLENDGLNKVAILVYEGRRFRDPCIRNLCNKCNGHNTSSKMTLAIIGEATRIRKRSECDVNNMKENLSQIQEALKENESNLSKIENKI